MNLLESLFGFVLELRETVGGKAVDVWEEFHRWEGVAGWEGPGVDIEDGFSILPLLLVLGPGGDVLDSMALGSAVDLAGLGKAMDVGGASRSVVILGRESLLLLGKRGLLGSGGGAGALAGAILVRRTLEFLRRAACLELLTPGMPGVVWVIPGVGEVYVRALAM